MGARLRIVGQGISLALVAGLLGLLVWKVAFANDGGAATQLANGKHPPAPLFTLSRLNDDGSLSLASLPWKAEREV